MNERYDRGGPEDYFYFEGLDSVTYFPVLTVSVGILVKLLIDIQGDR